MPELPDVEGFRRVLAEHAQGRRISGVEVADPGVLRNRHSRAFVREVQGCRFHEPGRHGKWLLGYTDGPIVLFHFGMSGGLVWAPGGERHRHDRVVFALEHGELRYRDMRKLRGLWLALDEDEAGRIMGPLGPDALDLGRGELAGRLARHRGRLKPVLMDQTVVAGLGNLLVDEILWRSRLNPARPVHSLDTNELATLHRVMRRVLRDSVPEGRVPPKRRWLTGVRNEKPAVCPRCRHELRKASIGGRTSYWCPKCQPG